MTNIDQISQPDVLESTDPPTPALTSIPAAAPTLTPTPAAAPTPQPPTVWPTITHLATSVAAAAAIAIGSMAGMWYLPFIVGLAAGVFTSLQSIRPRAATAYAALASLGWPAVLLSRSLIGRQPIGATARAVAALAGLPPLAAVTIAATILVALLQALSGVWLGRAATAAVR